MCKLAKLMTTQNEMFKEGSMSISAERMTNAPVYYALIQVKFTPVAAMAKYVPEIQDALRVEGFPLFEVDNTTRLKFEIKNPNEPPVHSFENVAEWLMVSADKRSGFILGHDFITFHTTSYDTHEPFISASLLGLSKVLEFAKPSFISRIGLRYLDAVLPEGDEVVEQYLAKELHDVDFGLTPVQSIQEAVYQTSIGPSTPNSFLVTRVHKMNGQLGFPPDMVPRGLHPLDRFSNTPAKLHGIIDTDHYAEGTIPTDIQQIEKSMISLHSKIKEAFENMVTGFALSKWQ
jgi:uncharacterized protein (TIGR04255 family)